MNTLATEAIELFFATKQWEIAGTLEVPEIEGKTASYTTMKLAPQSKAYFQASGVEQVYLHQRLAIQCIQQGDNTCIATSTASGKTLAFHVGAIEELVAHPKHRIIAIYPTKALAQEQEQRWHKAMEHAGLNVAVRRIDGQVEQSMRVRMMRDAQILIVTPDIIHAWLMSHLSERDIARFLQHLALIIVDEVHSYTGVFGSNSAMLFRRLLHVCALFGTHPRFIAASATIGDPKQRLQKLFGIPFKVIGADLDASPKHHVTIQLVTPAKSGDLLTSITELLHHLVRETPYRFITFVDSRKQVEHISAIAGRPQESDEDEVIQDISQNLDRLESLQVLPFRAGYEEQDRDRIQERLATDALRGVISTSALELGMDIRHLSIAVLVGVPRSSTSLMQRIGRIGRHAPGCVIIINTGSVYDEAIFQKPEDILKRPPAEGALYLENERIQYIHALCLARIGGEHDQILTLLKRTEEGEFTSEVSWPDGFVTLCQKERLGEISYELQPMKSEGGDNPNYAYPLRDVEKSFQIELKQAGVLERRGSLSFSQVMREAYPGAVYYYITQPYRVYRILMKSHTIQVRHEKHYTTKPIQLPTRIFPNFSQGYIHSHTAYEPLIVTECGLQVSESISGVKERRGRNQFAVILNR